MNINTGAKLDELKEHIVQLEESLRLNTKDIEKQQELLDFYNKSLELFKEEEVGRAHVFNNFVYPIETQLKELNSRRENLLNEIKFKEGLRLILKEELSSVRAQIQSP